MHASQRADARMQYFDYRNEVVPARPQQLCPPKLLGTWARAAQPGPAGPNVWPAARNRSKYNRQGNANHMKRNGRSTMGSFMGRSLIVALVLTVAALTASSAAFAAGSAQQ